MVLSAQASQHYREDLTFRGAAFGSLDCQVQVQHLPEVAQLGGLRTDDGALHHHIHSSIQHSIYLDFVYFPVLLDRID